MLTHRPGAIARTMPISPRPAPPMMPAVHATRRARATWLAPMAMPTMGRAATPTEKAMGTSRNSIRDPMP